MSNLNRPKDFESSREEFVTAARAVFSQKGYHAASIDDIVTRAGRSKGGFYHHFQSKDQLFREVFEAALGATLSRLEEGMRASSTVREVLDLLIAKSTPSLLDPEQGRGTVGFLLQSLHDEGSRILVTSMHKQLVGAVASLLKMGAERGEISSNIDFHSVAEMMIASGRGIYITMSICGEPHRIPDLLYTYNRTALAGLAPQK